MEALIKFIKLNSSEVRITYNQVYTDWANRHLIKYGTEPIKDLTNDLREPRRLVTLLQAITFDCVPAAEERISTAIDGHTESV
ncbi:unnamed protein product [Cercopithifilaria johnstoni]|uniref:Uncharacterized protein n=1 Tax=Cercopithifilaria johnstoni TaxID=2874296 RepID=A0A8J2Q8X0_9BILA|nr:unnamed protein product [Cercopithifilaria johnstoni]